MRDLTAYPITKQEILDCLLFLHRRESQDLENAVSAGDMNALLLTKAIQIIERTEITWEQIAHL